MIQNFEKQTHELTDYEIRYVLPFIVKYFEKELLIGKENSITNKEIIDLLKVNNIEETSPRLRKVIGYIRKGNFFTNNYALLASTKGYYLSNDSSKIYQQVQSLRERANCIEAVADAMLKKAHKNEKQSREH